MQFTIQVEDFYLDEYEELAPALRDYIKHDVVTKISSNISDKVQKEITEKVAAVIQEKISLTIDSEISDLVATGIINRNGKEISIVEHVKEQFLNNRDWNSVNSHVDSLAKKFAAELKRQYDAAFANHIVSGLKQQGLLKDDVVELLLGNK